jgi:hypothetical protein
MLYVLDYTVSTLTGSSSGRYKNFESKIQNLVIHARRDPVWFTVSCLILTLSLLMSYISRTASLTYRRILYIQSTNIRTEYFKNAAHSPFFSIQNVVCFIILTFLVHILQVFTFYIEGVLKFKNKFSWLRVKMIKE